MQVRFKVYKPCITLGRINARYTEPTTYIHINKEIMNDYGIHMQDTNKFNVK